VTEEQVEELLAQLAESENRKVKIVDQHFDEVEVTDISLVTTDGEDWIAIKIYHEV
jgi:hypothetical protein